MAVSDHVDFNGFMAGVKRRNPYQPEFVQAVQEVAEDIFDFIANKEQYHEQQILRRIAEPDRVVSFRVCRSEEHTSELQSLMRISYAVFCLKKKKTTTTPHKSNC